MMCGFYIIICGNDEDKGGLLQLVGFSCGNAIVVRYYLISLIGNFS